MGIGTAVCAVANRLLASQVDYDAWTWAPNASVLSEQLWSLVVPQPWCAALRAIAQTLPEYNIDMPVTFYVKCNPQAYLGVRMELAALAASPLAGRYRAGSGHQAPAALPAVQVQYP